MKRLFVLGLMAALFAVTAAAQETPIDKGSMILGGTVTFQSYSGDLYNNQNGDGEKIFAFMPSFGYFIAPGVVIGADLIYHSDSQGDWSGSIFGIGPMVGYYFNTNKERTEIKGSMYPYVKGTFQYLKSGGDYVDETNTAFGGSVGINYMLSNAVAVDFGINVMSATEDLEGYDSLSGTVITIGAGMQAFIF
ncbi:MAG: hypothetical protein CVT49_02895 [candidate division Zixibacteria bacterium HGW-Zixibacteria-1]|nr:MAG: hypothetical protein CVT49_02895 [candidate division Zixibacteria bacterium HGW-Zixibacteria-1]